MAITAAEIESDVDPYADLTVWCTEVGGPAEVLDGFCATCGAHDHEVF
ncbi:hypothetical protein [Georgenia deserti]|uniref:Uncharacterized protein n=1 Tax=Georgenia deserti TaxID=2093781 RepID=A0ABW4L2L1_9MICO